MYLVTNAQYFPMTKTKQNKTNNINYSSLFYAVNNSMCTKNIKFKNIQLNSSAVINSRMQDDEVI